MKTFYEGAVSTSVAFVPPNPKEFDRAAAIGRFFA